MNSERRVGTDGHVHRRGERQPGADGPVAGEHEWWQHVHQYRRGNGEDLQLHDGGQSEWLTSTGRLHEYPRNGDDHGRNADRSVGPRRSRQIRPASQSRRGCPPHSRRRPAAIRFRRSEWQLSTNGGTTFTNIAGATAKTYSFTTAGQRERRQVPGCLHQFAGDGDDRGGDTQRPSDQRAPAQFRQSRGRWCCLPVGDGAERIGVLRVVPSRPAATSNSGSVTGQPLPGPSCCMISAIWGRPERSTRLAAVRGRVRANRWCSCRWTSQPWTLSCGAAAALLASGTDTAA